MNGQFFFSIIIPVFNRETLIVECIKNLKNQSFKNWECIIINDGSTDNTKKYIENEILNDSHFKLINQKNSERAIARNNGAKHAKGKYFIFLDSDDYFETNHLSDLHKHIVRDEEKIGMYFTNGRMSALERETQLINPINHVPNIDFSYFVENSVVPARVCIHNDIMKHLSFDPRAIIVEDTVLWTEILEHYPVNYVPIESVIYQIHSSNSVNLNVNNAYKQRLHGLKVLFFKKKVGKRIPKRTIHKQTNRCYLGIAEYYSLHGNRIQARFWMLKSIILFPHIETRYKFKTLLTSKF